MTKEVAPCGPQPPKGSPFKIPAFLARLVPLDLAEATRGGAKGLCHVAKTEAAFRPFPSLSLLAGKRDKGKPFSPRDSKATSVVKKMSKFHHLRNGPGLSARRIIY